MPGRAGAGGLVFRGRPRAMPARRRRARAARAVLLRAAAVAWASSRTRPTRGEDNIDRRNIERRNRPFARLASRTTRGGASADHRFAHQLSDEIRPSPTSSIRRHRHRHLSTTRRGPPSTGEHERYSLVAAPAVGWLARLRSRACCSPNQRSRPGRERHRPGEGQADPILAAGADPRHAERWPISSSCSRRRRAVVGDAYEMCQPGSTPR